MKYRSAVITGASSGLGRGLAKLLARENIPVALLARRIEELEALANDINRGGGRAVAIRCDVGNAADVERAVRDAETAIGPIDLMVCNAGISKPVGLRRLTPGPVEEVLRVNFLGVVHGVTAVLPSMIREQKGHIVAISSIASMVAFPQNGAYSSSKVAVNNFLASLRPESEPLGIKITTICPGFIRTPMTEKNEFPMPFLMTEEEALRRIWCAIRSERRFYAFPRRMHLVARILALMPPSFFRRTLGKQKGA